MPRVKFIEFFFFFTNLIYADAVFAIKVRKRNSGGDILTTYRMETRWKSTMQAKKYILG